MITTKRRSHELVCLPDDHEWQEPELSAKQEYLIQHCSKCGAIRWV